MTDLFLPLFVYSLSPSVRDCLIKMTRRVKERGIAPNLQFYDGALEDADQRRADFRRRGAASCFSDISLVRLIGKRDGIFRKRRSIFVFFLQKMIKRNARSEASRQKSKT